jgi:hypothetical protein
LNGAHPRRLPQTPPFVVCNTKFPTSCTAEQRAGVADVVDWLADDLTSRDIPEAVRKKSSRQIRNSRMNSPFWPESNIDVRSPVGNQMFLGEVASYVPSGPSARHASQDNPSISPTRARDLTATHPILHLSLLPLPHPYVGDNHARHVIPQKPSALSYHPEYGTARKLTRRRSQLSRSQQYRNDSLSPPLLADTSNLAQLSAHPSYHPQKRPANFFAGLYLINC